MIGFPLKSDFGFGGNRSPKACALQPRPLNKPCFMIGFPLKSDFGFGGNRNSGTRSPLFMTGLLRHAGFRSAGAASLIPSCARNLIWFQLPLIEKGFVEGTWLQRSGIPDALR